MSFTSSELDYLRSQLVGRLATRHPDGTLQVNPVGYRVNAELSTIDLGGFGFTTSRKFRNVVDNGQVAFVVDDVVSTDPWRIRCLEVRGTAEPVVAPEVFPDLDDTVLRITPRRIICFGVDEPDVPPHLLTYDKRDVA